MGKLEDIQRLERMIKDAEIRVKAIKLNETAFNREIAELSLAESGLSENVKTLKKRNVIAIASEFKKTKDELRRTKFKIMVLKRDLDVQLRLLKDSEHILAASEAQLVKIKSEDSNNVLKGRFGKKND